MPTMITNQNESSPSAGKSASASRDLFAERCESIAAALVLVPCFIFLLTVTGFAAGSGLQAWYGPAALIAGMAFVVWRSRSVGETTIRLVVLWVVVGASLWLGARLGDTSFDSINYHQSAVSELRHGWNPWHGQSSGRFASERTWVDNYPQASWINAAAAGLLTGRIDSGKWINFVFAAASFLAVFALLLRATRASATFAVVLAFIAAANPVTLCQMNTFYVDGTVAASVTVLIAGLWLVAALGRASGWWLVAPALLLLMNFKHTGIAYGMFLSAGAVGLRISHANWRKSLSTGLALLAIGLTGLGFFGYAPYVKNVLEGRHVFHPVLGAERIDDFMGERKTPNLPGNRFLDFVVSHFARSDYPDHRARPAQAKFPFMVYRSELIPWYSTDVKSGGYGPLYGALLLASAGGLAALIFTKRRSRVLAVLGLVAALGAGVFCHEFAWWARYAPQGWLLACIVPAIVLDLREPGWRCFRIGVLGIGGVNCAILLVATFVLQGRIARDLNLDLDAAARSAPVVLRLDRFPVLAERFRERGIPFVITSEEAPGGVERHPIIRGNPEVYWFKKP